MHGPGHSPSSSVLGSCLASQIGNSYIKINFGVPARTAALFVLLRNETAGIFGVSCSRTKTMQGAGLVVVSRRRTKHPGSIATPRCLFQRPRTSQIQANADPVFH